jgi:hypothetical protein
MLEEQHCYNQYWTITICNSEGTTCVTVHGSDPVCFTVYSETGPGGGGGGSGPTGPQYGGTFPTGGGGGSGTPPSETFMDKINDTQLKPCMKSVLNSIKTLSNGSIAGIIQKFAGETPGFNWTLIDEALPPNWNGSTNPIYNAGTVTTTFDSQKFTHASDLAIARTILHESVHAYLVASFKNDPTAYLLNYGQLMKKWQDKNGSLNDFQHDLMTKNFIVDIGIALKEYGASKGYNLTDQFCNDLAWGGLDGTTTFTNLSNSDKTRIMNVILLEQTGFDSLGEQKVRKGKLSSCYDIGVE